MKQFCVAMFLVVFMCMELSCFAKKSKKRKKVRKKFPVPEHIVTGDLKHYVLASGSGRVFIFDKKGKVVWQHRVSSIHDATMLDDGTLVMAGKGGAYELEVGKKMRTVYTAKNKKGGLSFACQKLKNGNILTNNNPTGKLVEIDKDGKVVFELQTKWKTNNKHHRFRICRKLENGNYLVCHSGDHIVREYKPDGSVAWEHKCKNLVFSAIRLKNGNTLVSSLSEVTEYTPAGKKVWEFTDKDIPDMVIRNITGIRLLDNGNLVCGCYDAYDKNGEGAGAFEITHDKKLVWKYANPARDRALMVVQVLDDKLAMEFLKKTKKK